MFDETLTAADRAFYEWLHYSGEKDGAISVNNQHKMFMAGWAAAMEGQSDE